MALASRRPSNLELEGAAKVSASLSARANHTAGRGRSRLVFPCVCSGED